MKKLSLLSNLIALAALILLASAPVPAHAANGILERLLGQVPATPQTKTILWYGSQSALEQSQGLAISSAADVSKLTVKQQGAYLKAFGGQLYVSPFLGLEDASWRQTFGFDSYQVDRELTVGISPNWLDILEGNFDVGAVGSALGALGYKGTPTGSSTLYAFGGAAGNEMSTGAYRSLLVSPNQIVAAPNAVSVQGIAQATANQTPDLAADPSYLAVARALEPDGTPLISTVIMDVSYVQQMIGPGALPKYNVVGISYAKPQNGTARWIFALVYPDKASADAAAKALPGLLAAYQSQSQLQSGRALFAGWKPNASVATADKAFVAVVSFAPTAASDIDLVPIIQEKDFGFLGVR